MKSLHGQTLFSSQTIGCCLLKFDRWQSNPTQVKFPQYAIIAFIKALEETGETMHVMSICILVPYLHSLSW